MLVVMVAIAMSACGDESKTKALFKDINKDTGIHMKYSMDLSKMMAGQATSGQDQNGQSLSGQKMEMEIFIKGENAYVDTTAAGTHSITILKDGVISVLNPQAKTATQMKLSDQQKSSLEQLTKTPESMKEASEQEEYKTETKKIDGMEYETEVFEKGSSTATFAYNDDGELAYIIAKEGSTEVTMKIEALDGDVKDSQFDVPSGYTVQQAGQNSSQNNGSGSNSQNNGSGNSANNNSGSNSNNGSSSSGSSGSGKSGTKSFKIGGDGTVVCKDGAFSFKTDKNYIAHVSGGNVDIYLEKENSLPVFRCYKMPRVDGQSANDFLRQSIRNLEKSRKGKFKDKPKLQTITVNGEKVRGYKYSYNSDYSDDSYTGENFAVFRDDAIYSWSSLYNTGDNVTPAEVQAAMETFEEM